MEKHGVDLNTLKQCLMFLQWLKTDESKLEEVSRYLHGRIKNYFEPSFGSEHNVKEGLRPFLTAVSEFYTRLCHKAEAGSYGNKTTDQIADALLDCVPKFLAAIYYLWYCVDPSFVSLGGGGWQKDWPGYGERSWHGDWGGDLDRYLRAQRTSDKYGDMIPGGFIQGEVKYREFWKGYYQGYNMADDIQKILKKQPYNFFRSVFVSSVFSNNSGTAMQNTANAVSLVRTFCDIVLGEEGQEGGELIHALNDGLRQQVSSTENSICWKDLKDHCAQLRKKFDTFFEQNKRFDFTGQSIGLNRLQTKELAKETAKWMRMYLNKVRGKLTEIDTDDSIMKTPAKDLGAYFTKNLFPYGFTFNGQSRFHMQGNNLNGLKTDWRDVINEFKRSDGDLDRLVEILNGKNKTLCPLDEPPKEVVPEKKVPVAPPKKPEAPPAKVPEAPKEVVPEKKVPVPKRPEGAQNQGKKAESSPTPNNGQSEGSSPTSPGGDAVSHPPSGDQGASGPRGPTMFPQVPGSPVQNTDQTQQAPPQPPPAPPPLPGAAGSDGQPGVKALGQLVVRGLVIQVVEGLGKTPA
ncbi:ribosome binding protein, putative [Babesia ovata]|uniref:Ribosome binding protein, putative n=1 Tax=Babesia ovata TaxID=189622 RepID=A0A2H6KFX1_9APIC|nr:ribosome binding protein, putative [Babesia ovata]GBE61877.1 ribosome binding protein, putative [Babesia ovata]